jgi:hypothetical protein
MRIEIRVVFTSPSQSDGSAISLARLSRAPFSDRLQEVAAIYARFTDGYDTEDLMDARELLMVRQQGAELEKIALHSQGSRVAAQVRRHTHSMYSLWYCKTLN